MVDRLLRAGLFCAFAVMLSCSAEDPEPVPVQLSEKPIGEAPMAISESRASNIGFRLRIGYQELAAIVASEVPLVQTGDGQKRLCKRVIGVKVCGTADWQYTATRTGDIAVSGGDDRVILILPLQFEGTAGIQGDVAKVLGLRSIDFSGALEATIRLSFDLAEDWCPVITSDIDYHWTQTPKAEWAGGFDIDLRNRLDETLAKQLETVDDRIKEAIDCGQFREQLAAQWKQHSYPLQLPTVQVAENEPLDSELILDPELISNESDDPSTVYLNLEPKGFAFSGMRTEGDRLGITFLLRADTTVDPEPALKTLLPLPPVDRTEYAAGYTQFELNIRIGYQQLVKLLTPELVGRTFTSSSSAGDVAVSINALELFGSGSGLTIGIGFDADLPTTSRNTPGTVYLTTTPVVDPFNRTLTLTNTTMSKIIDNTLWSILVNVFEGRIIRTIEERAVIDLAERLEDLELKLGEQLSNPERTGGVLVTAEKLSVNLLDLVPESRELAVLLRVNALFDIDVPASVIELE